MKVSIIVARRNSNAIGKDNDLLWHLPADMKFFRETTSGHFVITGRKNYESIPEKYRPLKNRTNVVVTRNSDYKAPGAVVVSSIEEGIKLAQFEGEDECFIIGGGQIYKQVLENNLVDRMYITNVIGDFEADTFFPSIDPENWFCKEISRHEADEKNPFDIIIDQYDKKK